jgi:hypothetical protein
MKLLFSCNTGLYAKGGMMNNEDKSERFRKKITNVRSMLESNIGYCNLILHTIKGVTSDDLILNEDAYYFFEDCFKELTKMETGLDEIKELLIQNDDDDDDENYDDDENDDNDFLSGNL